MDWKKFGNDDDIIKYILSDKKDNIKYDNFPEIIANDNSTLIDSIIEGNSFLRFGDGEFRMCFGRSIRFQQKNIELTKKMREIIGNFYQIQEKYKCRIGLYILTPSLRFNDEKNLKTLKVDFMSSYNFLYKNGQFDDNFKSKFKIDNPFIFRWHRLHKDFFLKFENYLFNKKYIIVGGNKILHKYKNTNEINQKTNDNKLFKNAENIILCSEINAYPGDYNRILNACLNYKKEYIFILSIGPCAKLLGYELIQKGYQVIDTGLGLIKLKFCQ